MSLENIHLHAQVQCAEELNFGIWFEKFDWIYKGILFKIVVQQDKVLRSPSNRF